MSAPALAVAADPDRTYTSNSHKPSSTDSRVLAAIVALGQGRIRRATLASSARLLPADVSRATRRLVALGLLEKRSGQGRGRVTWYHVCEGPQNGQAVSLSENRQADGNKTKVAGKVAGTVEPLVPRSKESATFSATLSCEFATDSATLCARTPFKLLEAEDQKTKILSVSEVVKPRALGAPLSAGDWQTLLILIGWKPSETARQGVREMLEAWSERGVSLAAATRGIEDAHRKIDSIRSPTVYARFVEVAEREGKSRATHQRRAAGSHEGWFPKWRETWIQHFGEGSADALADLCGDVREPMDVAAWSR